MVVQMKQIRSSIEYEGSNDSELRRDLQAWHSQHPFNSGIDWQSQYQWATMTDEDCLAFCLKYPQYSNKFKEIYHR